MKYLKSFNESIRDKMIPKSKEEIKKSLAILSPDKKFIKIKRYNLKDVFTDEENKIMSEDIKQIIDSLSPEKKLRYIIDMNYNEYDKKELLDLFLTLDLESKYNVIWEIISHYHFTITWNNKTIRMGNFNDLTEEDYDGIFKEKYLRMNV